MRCENPGTALSIREDHCPFAGQKHSLLDVIANGICQRVTFNVLAFCYQLFRIVIVIHRLNALCDDRAFIQVVVHVMCRSPDQFHTLFPGLVVGFGPLKPGNSEWWILIAQPSSLAAMVDDRTCI